MRHTLHHCAGFLFFFNKWGSIQNRFNLAYDCGTFYTCRWWTDLNCLVNWVVCFAFTQPQVQVMHSNSNRTRQNKKLIM